MPFSVCIYEDNNNLRESLCSLLSLTEQYQVKAAFADCLNVEQQIKKFQPDVILMDVDLPGLNGIDAVKKIRVFNKDVQVIMLTIFDDDAHVFTALQAGANGYLLKKNISDKLIPSIAEVLDGGAPMSPAIARMVIDKMQSQQIPQHANYQLTPREKEILSSLSKGNSHKMISAALNISIETVRSHLKKIYDKLHVHSQTEAVSKAFNERLV
ncbi:MAG: response regulator transcription factor [Ferruginibacter sp.]